MLYLVPKKDTLSVIYLHIGINFGKTFKHFIFSYLGLLN